jgi:hypothetical protein
LAVIEFVIRQIRALGRGALGPAGGVIGATVQARLGVARNFRAAVGKEIQEASAFRWISNLKFQIRDLTRREL